MPRLADVPIYAAQTADDAPGVGAPAADLLARLSELRTHCDARLVAAYHEHPAGLAAGDGERLRGCVEQLAAIGARRYASGARPTPRASSPARVARTPRAAAARVHELHLEGQGGLEPVLDGVEGIAIALTPARPSS